MKVYEIQAANGQEYTFRALCQKDAWCVLHLLTGDRTHTVDGLGADYLFKRTTVEGYIDLNDTCIMTALNSFAPLKAGSDQRAEFEAIAKAYKLDNNLAHLVALRAVSPGHEADAVMQKVFKLKKDLQAKIEESK